jgi:hypothetical protein
VAVVKSQASFPSQLAAAPRPAEGPADEAALEAAARGRTGIVVVHGIGSQLPAETLLQWTAPLIEVLTAWRRADAEDGRRKFPASEAERPIDPVKDAAIDFHSPFPTISLRIPETELDGRRHPAREWLITEAWWASNVAPPGLSTMINWLGPGGGAARVVDGILGNEGQGSVLYAARAILVPIVSVVAGLALSLYGLVRSITAIIPIKSIRDASILRQFDEFLIGWFGDVRILLFDPAQSANIRAGLSTAVQRLRERCDHVVVVAHSGGAMISFLTLTDPQLASTTQVDKLVTFGEGWNLALRLTPGGAGMADRLRRDITVLQPNLRWRDFHASHDPAPAGPLQLGEIRPTVRDASRVRSFRVWNRLSVLADHGGYFDNDEEFALPLLRELDVPDGWGESSRFYPADAGAETQLDPDTAEIPEPRVARHRQRVSILALWRQTVVAATVATVALGLALAPGNLLALGETVAQYVPRIPIVADVIDAIRQFAQVTLETITFDPPLLPPVEPGQIAAAVDWLGIGVLQAVVIMAGLYVVGARTRAFLAWPAWAGLRRVLWLYEAALSVALAVVVIFVATIAPAHDELLGAGFSDWIPGILVTLGTIVIATVGTVAAEAVKATVVSSAYAVASLGLFLVALACAVLTIFRYPGFEQVEIAYVVIWAVALVLLAAGNNRWANWDRFERRVAYGPVAAVAVSRRPVIASSLGFLTLAGTGIALVLTGPGVWIVYAALVGIGLVIVGAALGARDWQAASNPVAAPDAVESARGSV